MLKEQLSPEALAHIPYTILTLQSHHRLGLNMHRYQPHTTPVPGPSSPVTGPFHLPHLRLASAAAFGPDTGRRPNPLLNVLFLVFVSSQTRIHRQSTSGARVSPLADRKGSAALARPPTADRSESGPQPTKICLLLRIPHIKASRSRSSNPWHSFAPSSWPIIVWHRLVSGLPFFHAPDSLLSPTQRPRISRAAHPWIPARNSGSLPFVSAILVRAGIPNRDSPALPQWPLSWTQTQSKGLDDLDIGGPTWTCNWTLTPRPPF
ncbi:uncharacterized protein N7459_000065 [Penicillium hispanicum]|uniref:uncharacterized protein n=1 Tax=Penicillium hispanicum TaxID=1080232 RepID=UPI002541E9AB|nr:uncharacterized protein N7459_000065 [Penicillium hispanicum]KAJ5593857.1 hypothetical protein N7459_000065 [Penicillium hispanicum]